MSVPADRLDPTAHAKILKNQILPASGIDHATAQAHPKAIILAGQPGAGKGGLVATATQELGGNVVPVDPDALRDFHPRVNEFRANSPYTWADHTHQDASQWAKELRAAVVDQRKNIIIDTTLGNGNSAVDLVKDLKAKGYEVEIRAIATHSVESELGVDARFAASLDKNGFGRYVPAEIRREVYQNLPGNLDRVRTETGTPVRIFNREGVELYDSRLNTQTPGEALHQAREARMRDPAITQAQGEQWAQRQQWHEQLPERLKANPNIDAKTAERLLAERQALNIADDVAQGARQAAGIDHAVRVRPGVVKGLSALGVAATAYDAATTGYRVHQLSQTGNEAGIRSEVVRFGATNLGAWGGASLGAFAGGVAGVETGPGLLVTGAIGGVVGAVAGNELAQWLENRRINRQDDQNGNTWRIDPKHPDQGWHRSEDVARTDPATGKVTTTEQTFVASPELANYLNYKASNEAIQLRLATPPAPVDPYSIPSAAGDAHSASKTDWKRSEDGKWNREIVDGYVEHGIKLSHHEAATPQRAAELDRQSQQVIADNALRTPAAMAARYDAAYAAYGWSQYGKPPEPVEHARGQVESLQASDGDVYRRNDKNEWISSGWLYDSKADGKTRQELDATQTQLRAALAQQPQAPARGPVSAHDSLRETLATVYQSAGIAVTPQHLEAATQAVERKHAEQHVPAGGYAIQVQAAPGERAPSANSHLVTLQDDGKGVYVPKATTTGADIEQAKRNLSAAPSADLQAPPADHADRKLFDGVRVRAPTGVSNEKVMEAVVAAKVAGYIREPGDIQHVESANGRLFVSGKVPGSVASVELATPAPSMQQSLQRSEAFDQQHAQSREQHPQPSQNQSAPGQQR
ncbi:zeta toxin family protein [Lysobacter sp. K5869]|uniref:zeta toxin family protein n=1 Tax=Lysobacter sp. K5869 TaxID=2820808 RepID=UPI001C061DDD|nr:zeta toxin family protein [Lysobacter sp. K5869]QWP74969.1 zeta toxin family protein [Lysobacter sp. K5869]